MPILDTLTHGGVNNQKFVIIKYDPKKMALAQKYGINKKSTILLQTSWYSSNIYLPTHDVVILAKSHKDRGEIVEFLLIANV